MPDGAGGGSARVALVTGASSGLGHAIAVALAGEGYRLVLHGRDERRLADLAGRTGGTPVTGDLSVPAEVERLAERAAEVAAGHGAGIDVLVNNAGVGWAGAFEEMDAGAAERLLAVNLAAPAALTRMLLPSMLARGRGRLVFVTSIAGRLGVAGESLYAATKGGLDVFAESLRLELRGTGVTVTVVLPGVVDTPFFERRGAPYQRRRPRPIPPDRVAAALTRGIAGGAAEVRAPRWLGVPVAFRGVLPGLYRRLSGRFGERVARTPAASDAGPQA